MSQPLVITDFSSFPPALLLAVFLSLLSKSIKVGVTQHSHPDPVLHLVLWASSPHFLSGFDGLLLIPLSDEPQFADPHLPVRYVLAAPRFLQLPIKLL